MRALIAVVKSAKNGRPVPLDPAIKEKIVAAFPSVQSEIMGGRTGVGAKLAAEVGAETGKSIPSGSSRPTYRGRRKEANSSAPYLGASVQSSTCNCKTDRTLRLSNE